MFTMAVFRWILFCASCVILVDASKHVDSFRKPAEFFYDLQNVDHFDRTERNYWKQRFFTNDAYRVSNTSPVFLLLGGHEAADRVWLQQGAMVEYARTHGALMVMLEHRYYGKSRPVSNLTLDNLRHLSSAQALADIAGFIPRLGYYQNVSQDAKIILFGGGYAGSLATWFRSKYPYLVHGAVATSPPLVATSNFMDYLLYAGNTLDTISTNCTAAIREAGTTMFFWWGQPEKRPVMERMFRLCDKIDHSVDIDLASFFFKTATNFVRVIEYNLVNRTIEGLPDGTFTMTDACDVMTETWGTSIERYAKAQSLVLDQYREPCLDFRFQSMMEKVNQTSWDSVSAEGDRQWLYQICTEFGWSPDSMSHKQPFSGMFSNFPQNFTNDMCYGAFGTTHMFSVVESGCDETNQFYGGLDMTVSKILIVNGDVDPWRSVSATTPMKNSPGAEIIVIPGTAHRASMYPSSARDPPPLVQARARMSATIGKWLAGP